MRHLVAIAVVLVAALAVVATLQYRWIGAISAAEEQRARALRDIAANHFAGDVDRDVAQLAASFQGAQPEEVPGRYRDWLALARDKRLVEAVYVGDPDHIRRFDGQKLVETTWPKELEPIRKTLKESARPRREPLFTQIPAIALPLRPGPPPRRMEDEGFRPPPGRDGFGPPPEFGGRPPFMLDGGPPPLVRAMIREQREGPRVVILQLSRDYLTHSLFPALTRTYFGSEYDVAIANGSELVYRSDPHFTRGDIKLSVLRVGPPDSPSWQLLVRRHGAAIEDVIAASRRRNLAIGSAVLALLAGSFILLAVLARRAERQRLQQLEFVAGITHEVNTPLAALTSAGQNLADGVVNEPARVASYGAMIVKESHRLTDLVGQVLDFAGLQARGPSPKRERIDVASLIDEAIAQSRWIAEERKVAVEKTVADDLPSIDGDPSSLTRAVQNLIANAIRHGGDGGWVGIRAERDRGNVAITVEDHGGGIAARDLPHLFEPFYRGRNSDLVRGTGLGLAIVQQIVHAHGGAVAVDRHRARGAAFTLRLPAEAAHA